jgi:hypothetical protein
MVSKFKESLNERIRKYFFQAKVQSQSYEQVVEIKWKRNTAKLFHVDIEFSTLFYLK